MADVAGSSGATTCGILCLHRRHVCVGSVGRVRLLSDVSAFS